MPSPRIFVSSTCYDLQEVRGNLRKFIDDFGYDPIMSDFGDIFYDFDKHVQDSCVEAIESSDMYILIIGDYYGSLYHKESKLKKQVPDSVTLKEFKKALGLNKPKLIFINKFVEYDYRNYRRFLDKKYNDYFSENDLVADKVEEKKFELKKEFDELYHFPNKNYKFIFHFLDKVDELKIGNAYYKFENSQEIKETLKRQWAGLLQESLKNKKDREKSGKGEILKISSKLESLEKLLHSLLNKTEKNNSNKLTIDISKFTEDIELENLEKLQQELKSFLDEILHTVALDDNWNDIDVNRITFEKKIEINDIANWLENLEEILKIYKWSPMIKVNILFSKEIFKYTLEYEEDSIEYKVILKLHSMYKNLDENDKESFLTTIMLRFKEQEKIDDFPVINIEDDDEFPF